MVDRVVVRRARVGAVGYAARLLYAIVVAALLHLIPAGLLTVPVSLGSAHTHRQLGMVWGLLLLVCWPVATFWCRQLVVSVVLKPRGGPEPQRDVCGWTDCGGSVAGELAVCVPNASIGRWLAAQIERHCGAGAVDPTTNSPPLPRGCTAQPDGSLCFRVWTAYRALVCNAATFAVLLAHAAVIFGVFVAKCWTCGGCHDNHSKKGEAFDECYYTGNPARVLATGVLILVTALLALKVRRSSTEMNLDA